LYRVLDQIAPQIIHVKCSYQGWQIFARYGRQLSLKSRLWVSLYCIDYQRTGAATSFAFHELLAAAPYLEYLLADNQGLLEDLQRTVAVKNIQKIFYPVEATPTLWEKSDVGSKALRVLWCSRLSFQKDINTLLRIAFLLPHVQFHVFGELSENTNHAQVLANFKNVKIWGIFDGVGDIPLNEYDVFLYTSFWDGLPNILLEIGIRGMPVISPKVGGITEILNGQNSYLYGNLRELKSILESWPKERNQGKARALLLRKDIETHHNWDQFMQKCQELYGH
jgi:glycosyltransferase involved in cell wall biosynthesis